MMTQVRGMTAHLPEFWQGLKTHTWPGSFFRVTMGLTEAGAGQLPAIARGYLIAYFLMALAALALRYGKKQRCVSNLRQKLTDLFLTIVSPLLVRMIVVIFQVGREMAGNVGGSFAFTLAGLDWLGKVITAWFFPMGLCLILLVILLIPLAAVGKYLREYKAAGLIWSVYDVGFGFVCLSSAVLAMDAGNPAWYLAIGAAAVLVLLGQIGGARKD